MSTRVSILKRNGNKANYYDTYSDARTPSVAGDVIIIWGDLTNEQIILKDGVDIWIMLGVMIKSGSSLTTIIGPTTGDLNCNIYGQGIIKNDNNGNCILIDNVAANVTMECDNIDGTGGSGSSVSVYIRRANKFNLTCNKVYNRDWQAIRLGEFTPGLLVQNINLNISKVETGNITASSPFTGTTAITTRGNGFLNINEILCRNAGHCLSHREGIITARINKLTSINNSTQYPATVHVAQYDIPHPGTGTQKLVLYFDEIQALRGVVTTNFSTTGVEISEGTGIFIGRKVFCIDAPAFQIVGAATKGFVKCNEIVSQGRGGSLPVNAVELSSFTNQITIIANFIQGYRDNGVVFINEANVLLRNAKLINTFNGSSPSSVGLFIVGNQINTLVNLVNIKIVTGNTTSGRTIYYPGPEESINIKNYGLFVNKAIDSAVNLLVGPELGNIDYNFQYIEDPLLT
jgi:hypothetical protein